MTQLLTATIDERTSTKELEKIRRNLVDVLREEQARRPKYVYDVELADGVNTPIAHRLGRPAFVTPSPVRGASSTGRIEEVRDSDVTRIYPRAQFVVLKATGWGATITVDVKAETP